MKTVVAMAMLVRGPIPHGAATAIDPRDGSEILVMDVDVHKRLPSNLVDMTDELLKGTLEELLERAVDLGLTTADGAKATRRNVATGKFNNRHYIELWAERLAELDRQGLLPPIGRKLEGWEIQARCACLSRLRSPCTDLSPMVPLLLWLKLGCLCALAAGGRTTTFSRQISLPNAERSTCPRR